MHIVPPSDLAKESYHIFCQKEQNLPIFFQDWYLDACALKGNWEVILVYHDQHIIAAYTYFIKKKWGFTYVTMPMFQKWMGLYIVSNYSSYSQERRILKLIIPYLPQVDRFEQNIFPGLQNWSPFYWQHYLETTYYTYQLNLDLSEKQLLSRLNGNVRRNIQQAEKLFHLAESIAPEVFYQINKKSFSRKNDHIPYDLSAFFQHHSVLQTNDSGKILAATDENGTVCAVCYLIWDENVCYYHLAGDIPNFRSQAVGIWLIWRAILYAKNNLNCTLFDFEGSMMMGTAQVRQRFNAQPIPYHVVQQYNNPILKLLSTIRAFTSL